MPRRIASLAASGCLVGLSASGVLLASAQSASAQFTGQVTLCHRTDSVTNPYTQETISVNAARNRIVNPGPSSVVGVFPTNPWGDIIPPFIVNGVVYSLNWTTAGAAIWNGGCDVDLNSENGGVTTTTSSTTTTSTTTTSTTSTTAPSGTTTSTTAPSGTTTSTTAPSEGATTSTTAPSEGATTSTTAPSEGATTTTTAPGTAPAPPDGTPPPTEFPGAEPSPFPTLPPNGGALPPIEAEVVDPGDVVVDLGTLDPTETAELESDLQRGVTNDSDGDGTDAVPGGVGAATGKPFGAEEIAGTVLAAGGATGAILLYRKRRRGSGPNPD